MLIMQAMLFIDGGIAGTGIFWIYTFPILAFFLCDYKGGIRWNLLLVFVFGAISISSIFGLIEINYDWVVIRQLLLSFLAVTGLTFFYTRFSGLNADALERRTKEISSVFEKKAEIIEEEAHKREDFLRGEINSFFEVTGDLMCIVGSEGKFIEINPAFTRELGYSREELLSKPYLDFIHPDDKANILLAKQSVHSGKPIQNFINRYVRKDGTSIWLTWNAAAYNGLTYGIAHPIDNLIETQEKLVKKNEELERLNKLMIGRELTMAEMKNEMKALKGE